MVAVFLGPDGAVRGVWKALLFALGAVLCGGAVGTLRPGLAGPWLPAPWFSSAAFLGLTWFCLQLEGRPLGSVGLRLDRRWARLFLLGALGGCGLMALMALVAYLGGGFHLVRNPQAGPAALLAGAWLFLAVAFSEEVLFRGYLFQRLCQGIGPWPAQLLVALLFAGVHWGNPGMSGATRAWASLDLVLAGLLLGQCYLRTRSLALPIGLHLGWNWAQGMLLGFGVSGLPSAGWWTPVLHGQHAWLTGGRFGLEASLPCALVAAAACLALNLLPSNGLLDK
jgi:membrane protease YdiL (CAAX protease family)